MRVITNNSITVYSNKKKIRQSPSDYYIATDGSSTSDEIAEFQKFARVLGAKIKYAFGNYKVGDSLPADGQWGRNTQEAYNKYGADWEKSSEKHGLDFLKNQKTPKATTTSANANIPVSDFETKLKNNSLVSATDVVTEDNVDKVKGMRVWGNSSVVPLRNGDKKPTKSAKRGDNLGIAVTSQKFFDNSRPSDIYTKQTATMKWGLMYESSNGGTYWVEPKDVYLEIVPLNEQKKDEIKTDDKKTDDKKDDTAKDDTKNSTLMERFHNASMGKKVLLVGVGVGFLAICTWVFTNRRK